MIVIQTRASRFPPCFKLACNTRRLPTYARIMILIQIFHRERRARVPTNATPKNEPPFPIWIVARKVEKKPSASSPLRLGAVSATLITRM